jgi:hypothetical protein
MLRTAKIAQIALRVGGVLTLLLGLGLWVGYGSSLRQVHMLLGMIVVLALWILAGIAAKVGAPLPRVVMAVLWGFVVVALGMTQTQFYPGSLHWMIRLTHLLVGIGAMAQGERLARFAQRFGVAAAATDSRAPA